MFFKIAAKSGWGNIDCVSDILKFYWFIKIQNDMFMNLVKPVKIIGIDGFRVVIQSQDDTRQLT